MLKVNFFGKLSAHLIIKSSNKNRYLFWTHRRKTVYQGIIRTCEGNSKKKEGFVSKLKIDNNADW